MMFKTPYNLMKGSDAKYNEAEIAAACQTFLKLNSYLQVETIQALEELAAKEKANPSGGQAETHQLPHQPTVLLDTFPAPFLHGFGF